MSFPINQQQVVVDQTDNNCPSSERKPCTAEHASSSKADLHFWAGPQRSGQWTHWLFCSSCWGGLPCTSGLVRAVNEKLYVTVISHIAHMKRTKWTAQAFWIILLKKKKIKGERKSLTMTQKRKRKKKKRKQRAKPRIIENKLLVFNNELQYNACTAVSLWVCCAVGGHSCHNCYSAIWQHAQHTIENCHFPNAQKNISFNGNTGETTNSHSGVHMGFPERMKPTGSKLSLKSLMQKKDIQEAEASVRAVFLLAYQFLQQGLFQRLLGVAPQLFWPLSSGCFQCPTQCSLGW